MAHWRCNSYVFYFHTPFANCWPNKSDSAILPGTSPCWSDSNVPGSKIMAETCARLSIKHLFKDDILSAALSAAKWAKWACKLPSKLGKYDVAIYNDHSVCVNNSNMFHIDILCEPREQQEFADEKTFASRIWHNNFKAAWRGQASWLSCTSSSCCKFLLAHIKPFFCARHVR